MAWIKIESPTARKPEIFRIARSINVSVDDALGKCVRFWIWLDGVTVDGCVDGVASTDVDALVDAPGFSDALVKVGWLEVVKDRAGILIPNFDRHNGETAKARALKARRQKKWRESRVDGKASTQTSTSPSTSPSTREEKSSIILSPMPNSLKTQRFESTWSSWLKHLQHTRGQVPSEQVQQAMLAECVRSGEESAIRNIEFSISRNAKNILDASKPKPNGNGKHESEDNMPPSIDELRRQMKSARVSDGC